MGVLYLTDLLHVFEKYDMLYFNSNYYQYDVTGDQSKLQNEESFNIQYCLGDQIKNEMYRSCRT